MAQLLEFLRFLQEICGFESHHFLCKLYRNDKRQSMEVVAGSGTLKIAAAAVNIVQ